MAAWVDGQYGIDGVYLGVPARLGREGVREVVELALTDGELAALRAAAEAVAGPPGRRHRPGPPRTGVRAPARQRQGGPTPSVAGT